MSSDFLPLIWSKARVNGRLYAIPLDTYPFIMYYNLDICKKAGLLTTDGKLQPLQGAQALLDAFKRAKQVTGNLGLSLDAQDVNLWRPFCALYAQMGGQILSSDGKRVYFLSYPISYFAEICSTFDDISKQSSARNFWHYSV